MADISESKKILVSGPFQPTLEEQLCLDISAAKAEAPVEPVLVVVGSHVAGLHLWRTLADRMGAHANVRILTLHELCRRLSEIPPAGKPVVDGPRKRFAVREVVRGKAAGTFFRSAADMPGLLPSLLDTFDDLEDGCFESPRTPGKQAVSFWESSAKVKQVIDMFESYREMLTCEYSTEAQITAAAAGRAGHARAHFCTGTILIYGIYDLTEAQRRLVTGLAGSLDVTFYLPFCEHPDFAYAAVLRDWLLSAGFKERAVPPVEPGDSNLSVLKAKGLPQETVERRQADDDGTTAIISAPGEAREVREIAREILFAARDRGIPFEDMAVVLRNPDIYMDLLRAEFERLGIPYFSSLGDSLARTREGRSLLLLFDLLVCDFARKPVLDFLRFAPLRATVAGGDGGFATPGAAPFDRISALANVVRGRDQWESRLPAFASGLHGGRYASAAGELKDITDAIFAGLSGIPESGRIEEFTGPLLTTYLSLMLPLENVERVAAAVGELEEAGRLAGVIDRVEFPGILKEHLSEKSIQHGHFKLGAVNVLNIMEARGTCFRLVLIPGLVEKQFPVITTEDPILLDAERRDLNRTGSVSLSLKGDRISEERLLFTLGTWMASERLVLSYPRLDPATGRVRIPSFFVLRAAGTLAGDRINYEKLESVPGFARVPLLPVSHPDPQRSLTGSELWTALALSEDEAVSSAAREHLLGDDRVRRAIDLIGSRYHHRCFSDFDGLITGVSLSRFLDQPLGATSLEDYTRCPYFFFHKHLLRIQSIKPPEDLLTIDPSYRGKLIHEILRDCYTRLREEGLLPLDNNNSEACSTILERIAGEAFRRAEREGACGIPALWEREKTAIMEGLLLEFEDGYRKGADFLPLLFEESFGVVDKGEVHVDAGLSFPLSLKGRIDRVDTFDEGRGLRVVDYKTGGRPGQRKLNPFLARSGGGTGLSFQAMIYILGASSVLDKDDWEEVIAELCYLYSRKGEIERITYGGQKLDSQMRILRTLLSSIIECLRAGVFIPYPSVNCRTCDYRTACPTERASMFNLKMKDAAAKEVLRLLDGELCKDD